MLDLISVHRNPQLPPNSLATLRNSNLDTSSIRLPIIIVFQEIFQCILRLRQPFANFQHVVDRKKMKQPIQSPCQSSKVGNGQLKEPLGVQYRDEGIFPIIIVEE